MSSSQCICAICHESLCEAAGQGMTNDADILPPPVTRGRKARGKRTHAEAMANPDGPEQQQQQPPPPIYRNRSNVVVTQCGHLFHHVCILQWFITEGGRTKRCPTCRRTCTTGPKGLTQVFLSTEPIPSFDEIEELKTDLRETKTKLIATERKYAELEATSFQKISHLERENSKEILNIQVSNGQEILKLREQQQFLVKEVCLLHDSGIKQSEIKKSRRRLEDHYGQDLEGAGLAGWKKVPGAESCSIM